VEDGGPMVKVDPPFPLYCFSIEDKLVSKKSISGQLTGLTTSSAEVILDHGVTVHSNLKILLDLGSEQNISEVYAKVLSQEVSDPPSSGFKIRLEFTWLPEDVKSMMRKRWLKDLK
jgi:hypothetical protein